jgi:tetratricopeptide (TPR) repeat protein
MHKTKIRNKNAIKLKRRNHPYSLNFKIYFIASISTFLLIIFILYFNTLSASFHLDDRTSIVENEAIQDIKDLKAIWDFSPTRFVTYSTFAVNYYFCQLTVTGYHIVNIVIHFFSVLLVWWFTLITLSTPLIKDTSIASHKQLIAFFSALLFAVHPVQTQAVTYIVQRLASLSTLLYLLSLCLYITGRLAQHEGSNRNTAWGFYASSAATAAIGMFTKETVFTLPLTIALYEVIFFKQKKFFKWKYFIGIILLLIIIPGTIYLTRSIDFTQLRAVQEGPEGAILISPGQYLFTQFRVLTTYLRLLFFPINQNLDYFYPVSQSFLEPSTLASFCFLLLIIARSIMLYPRYRLLTFAVLWFFITLIPESSIIPIRDVIFEHRLYLPMVGFSIFFVTLICYLFCATFPRAVFVILIAMVIGLSTLTYARNCVWDNELTLWDDTVKKSPDKERPYINRGFAYAQKGEFDQATADFDHALKINQNSAIAYYNRGLAQYYQGNYDKSIADYTLAIRMYPNYWQAYYNRGLAYFTMGTFDSAIADYTRVITLKPRNYDAHYNRGVAHGKKGEYDKALDDFDRAAALKLNNAELYYNRGLIYYLKGEYDKSIGQYSKALQLNDTYAKAYNNRAIVFFLQKEYAKAWDDVHKMQSLGFQADPGFLQKLRTASGMDN